MYEGIGGLMPLMTAAKDKANFPNLVMITMVALSLMHISFSTLCYMTFGNELTKPIIMEQMPQGNIIIQIVTFLFILNLVFSYPLTIYVSNIIIESFCCAKVENTACRKWMKNLSRSLVLLVGIISALYLAEILDKVFALCGTILGTTVVMTLPALCHYKVIACSEDQGSLSGRIVDIMLLIVSIGAMCLCTYQIVIDW